MIDIVHSNCSLSVLDRRSLIVSGAALALSLSPGCRASAVNNVRPNLYQCEGCDGVFERAAETLTSVARIGPIDQPGEPLTLTGRVMDPSGRQPVAAVIIYAYQTNADGFYADGHTETEWSRRHGNLRGWVKTDSDGRYRFDTIKPAPYPDQPYPAHIHLTVLEEGQRPYYIDDVVFEGEFGVTPDYRRAMELRGGNGVGRLTKSDNGVWQASRDIILEAH